MSQENVEIAHRLLAEAGKRSRRQGLVVDALDERSLSVIYASLDPAIEFHEDPRFPEAGIYRGVEACRQYLEQFVQSFDEFVFEAEDMIGLDDGRVLSLLRIKSRGKGSGASVELHAGWLFTFRVGHVVKIEAFLDREEALEAAGLSE
ncbi:MAG: nuclear transport factor 2 family protein [Solirubrobacterales bacterium]